MWTFIVCVDFHKVNIPLLTTNRNGLMPTRSLCLFKQSLNDIPDLILYQPDADPLDIKFHNLSLLFEITKLLFHNIFISLVKNILYSASS